MDVKPDKFHTNEFARKYKKTLEGRATMHAARHLKGLMAPVDSTNKDVKR